MWASTRPGVTRRPPSSSVSTAGRATGSTATMRSPVMAMSARLWRSGKRAPRRSRSTVSLTLALYNLWRSMTTAAPLAGYRVLELAHLVAGPACGLYLADMGADVIKVENPDSGDASRTAYALHLHGESAVFVTVNRNKRSLALDLAHPDGRRVFHRLVEGVD